MASALLYTIQCANAELTRLYFSFILRLLNPVCNIETRELALSETKLRMSGNLPVGEPGYQTYKCPRAPGVTSLYGVDFRHVRQKGPKSLPEGSLAPLEGYPSRAADTTLPLFWQDETHLRVPDSRSRQHLDLDYLERHAPGAIIKVWGDPKFASYMGQYYRHGGFDHSDLHGKPVERYLSPGMGNCVLPHTAVSAALDKEVRSQLDAGLAFSCPYPCLPGTIISPVTASLVWKVTSQKWKLRFCINGNAGFVDSGRSLGYHCNPEQRQYGAKTIHHHCCKLCQLQCRAVSMWDYKNFYKESRVLWTAVCRNAVYWKLPGWKNYQVIYFLMDNFGKADVPATNERHGRAVEAIQLIAIKEATGHEDGAVAIDRNCDDGVLMTSAKAEDEWAVGPIMGQRGRTRGKTLLSVAMTELERVTRENIRQPLQDAKTVYNAKRYHFHGHEMVLDMFPNKWGVYPGGVGLCANRCKHALRKLKRAVKGISRDDADSLCSLLEWCAAIYAMIKPTLRQYRIAVNSVKGDRNLVRPTGKAMGALQRMTSWFREGVMDGKHVPMYWLYQLTPHEAIITTDGSGYDNVGGYWEGTAKDNFFFTEPLHKSQRVSFELTGNRKNSSLTVELLALFYMIATARKRAHRTVALWRTDALKGHDAWVALKSDSPLANDILALISWLCWRHDIIIVAQWIPRAQNKAADLLTHDGNVSRFCAMQGMSANQQCAVPRSAVSKAVILTST